MSASEFFVDDPIITADGELMFCIWRTYFFMKGSVDVDYVISAGSAILDTDFNADADLLSGTVTFNQWDQWKIIRVNTMAGGGPANRTVICTLPASLLYRDGRGVGTGTIQNGDVYYFAAVPPGGVGTIGDPLDIQSLESYVNVTPAGGGAGRALFLKSGDTFPDWDGLNVGGSSRGGTELNPMIIGRYNNDLARPILYLSKPIGLVGENTDNGGRGTIFQDLELRPWSTGEVNQPIFHNQNSSNLYFPTGTQYLRILMHNPDDHPGFVQMQIANCVGLGIKYCEIFNMKHTGFLSSSNYDSRLIANYWKGNGIAGEADPAQAWAVYNSHDHRIISKANRFSDNIQGNKIRACGVPNNPGSLFSHNYFETREGSAVGGYNVNGSVYQWFIGATGAEYDPLTDCVVEKNLFVGGMSSLVIEADNHEEFMTGNQVVFDNLEYRNNVHVMNQAVFSSGFKAFKGSFQRNDGVNFHHNTTLVLGMDTNAIQQSVPASDIVIPDPAWANNIQYVNNIAAREGITSTTQAVVRYGGDPNDFDYVQNNNNYYDEDDNVMTADGTDYDLASYQAAFPGREAGSVEANPILIAGGLPVRAFPVSPIAAEAGLADDFFGSPRGSDTCAGALHRPVASPSPVYVG